MMLKNIRLVAFLYSAVMLAAIESVGIVTQGRVELEADRRDAYAAVLLASLSSYITENNSTNNAN